MKSQLSYLYLMLSRVIEPLEEDFSSLDAVENMFYRYGWRIPLLDSEYTQIINSLAIHSAIADLKSQVEALMTKHQNGEELEIADFTAMADKAMPIIQLIANFDLGDINTLAEPLNQSSFWGEIAEHLLEDLIISYLEQYQPSIFAILHIFGAIQFQHVVPQGDHRVPYQRKQFDWDQAADILTNPLTGFKNHYHWDDQAQALSHSELLQTIGRALKAIGMAAQVNLPGEDLMSNPNVTPSVDYAIQHGVEELRIPYVNRMNWMTDTMVEIGLSAYPVTDDPQQPPNGILLRPIIQGAMATDFKLNEDFEIFLGAGIDASNAIALKIFPSDLMLESGDIDTSANIGIRSTRTEPWYLFGREDSTHLAVHGISLELKIEGTAQDPELIVHCILAAPNGGAGLKAALKLDDADGFLQSILGSAPIEVGISPEIIWSSVNGISINGKPDFNTQFKLDQKIGGISIKNVELALLEGTQQTSQRSMGFRTGVEIAGKIGPLSFVVEKTGFQLNFVPYSRQDILALPPDADAPLLGNFDLDLDFAPPRGISLMLESSSVSGGGYLFFDNEKEQYAGILQLAFSNISLQAVGLITTRMPDGSKGFSMVIIISAAGFTPIQLGFGFTLVKVGGLLGINRTVNTDVLREGLKSGTLDSVLFPADPLANAPRIISDLRSAFPPAPDQYMFGPMVEIVWGRPVMLQIKAGIIFEFPTSPRLHILGRFQAGLPSLANPLIRLNMDALGSIYFDRKEIALDAVLYDSTLLDDIVLTGGMALRAGWGKNPQFILSVGGFNPRFPAPADFPVPERIAFTLANRENGNSQPNPLIELKAYFALTSNTAQVGSTFYLYASSAGFSVEGDLRFHALFEFTPFRFIIDIYGAVALEWKGMSLLAVRLNATLAGPTPWYIRGDLTIDTFLFDVSLSFEKQFGDDTPPALPPAVDPLLELTSALEDVRNWEGQSPINGHDMVTLREIVPADSEVLLHPQSELTVRQTVVPLNTDIELFGNSRPANNNRFDIKLILENGIEPETEAVEDYFAPAQFIEMSDTEKISSPSFEKMEAGVRMLNDMVTYGSGLSTDISYDTLVIGTDDHTTPANAYDLPVEFLERQARRGASGKSPLRIKDKQKYKKASTMRMSRRGSQYRLANTEDMAIPTDGGDLTHTIFHSFTAATEALAQYQEMNPSKEKTVQIVAAHLVA